MKTLKNLGLSLSICLSSITVFSQATTVGMGQEFKQLSGEIGTNIGYEGIQTYSSNIVKGSQFFYPGWENGSVTTTDNQIINNNYLFLFDKVRQLLFIKEVAKESSEDPRDILAVDQSKVFLFTLNTDKPHNFVKAALYDSSLAGKFFEILIQNENYSLFKLTETKFQKADKQDMVAVKNGELSDAFVDHNSYYVYHNHQLQKVVLRENSIRKILKDDKTKVNDYFNVNQSNEEINEDFLVGLVNALN